MQISLYNKHRGLQVRSAAETSILRTLAYFDIFHYPLTKEEVLRFLDTPVSQAKVNSNLQKLVFSGSVFFYQGFYSLQNNPLHVHRRKEGNERAEKLLVRAFRIGRFLSRFPYVRAIGISGSLSKNFADEKADIDFFIITEANRLWIARTFMHLFKKLTFLTGRQRYYCMNYYIDTEALLINEKNIYTATEIKTLMPVTGLEVLQEFFKANGWSDLFLPSCHPVLPHPKPVSRTRRSIEWVFNNRFGSWLDGLLLRVTTKRWNRKERRKQQNEKGSVLSLITGKHYARSNAGGFQEKVLALYEEKLRQLK
jgi:hypothetical protein